MEEQFDTTPDSRTNEQLDADIGRLESRVQSLKDTSGDSWDAALKRQRRERDAQNGMDTYSQMRGLVRQRELDELKNAQRAQDAIASALAIAQGRPDGQLPGVVTDYLNRQFGFDGQTMGLMGGGIDPNTGDFNFVFGERDNTGNIVQKNKTVPLAVQLGLMEGYPGMFNEDAVKAHREKMAKKGLSPREIEDYSNVGRFAREHQARRMEELTPRDTKLETERLRQEGLNRRADMIDERSNRKIELQQKQLEANIQKQLAAAKSADERNAILKQAKEAELRLRQQEIEARYAQMGIQYGIGDERKSAQEKIGAKLTEQPAEISIKGAKSEPPPAEKNPAQPAAGGETSSNGQTGKKVSYNGLKPGQTFFATGKDGKRHQYRKTENGHERIN